METLQSTYGDSEASEPAPTPPTAAEEDASVSGEPLAQPSSSEAEPEAEPMLEEKPTPLSDQTTPTPSEAPKQAPTTSKRKKKSKDVWSTTSRKKPKKAKTPSNGNHTNTQNTPESAAADPSQVLLTPIAKFPDKHDDSPELPILLSKSNKAEKVELSEDRLTASSSKGYRMVRATRGVSDGAWYFEVKIVRLGESGHTRLGWSTDRGDLQAPVGYDVHGYGYRDLDGSKVHKALRESYGDSYGENDVIGFYINLPDGEKYAPEKPRLVWYKGQRYVCGVGGSAGEAKEEQKIVPGSVISFFKNGVSQGLAFADLSGGRYYPAASMYTLPNQPSCVVKFNFGPEFEKFPENFGDLPIPKPMSEVPYQNNDARAENGGVSDEKKP